MHRTLLPPLKPLHNASFVELAQTLQSNQRLPNFIFLHADRALLRSGIVVQTILLGCCERYHPHG